jgi:hypothetical protein
MCSTKLACGLVGGEKVEPLRGMMAIVLAFPWCLTLSLYLRIHFWLLFVNHEFRSIRNKLCSGILLLVRITTTRRKSSKHFPLSLLLLLLLLLLSVQPQDCCYVFLTSKDVRRNEFHWGK